MIYSCRSLGAVVVMYLQRITGELFYAYSSFLNSLLAVRGTVRYGEVQRQVAQSLGITVRSVN
jgi:hypothetical protein